MDAGRLPQFLSNMKTIRFIFAWLAASSTFAAVHIQVDTETVLGEPETNLTCRLTWLGDPGGRAGKLITIRPAEKQTDANGSCTFSNVAFGNFRLELDSAPKTTYRLTVSTNLDGTYLAEALRSTSNAATVNPQFLTTETGTALILSLLGTAPGITNGQPDVTLVTPNLTDSAGTNLFDFNYRYALDNQGLGSVGFHDRSLFYDSGFSAVAWALGQMNDSLNGLSVDWNDRLLLNADGSTVMDYDFGPPGARGVAFPAGIFSFADEAVAINVDSRLLRSSSVQTTLDWEQNWLQGDWAATKSLKLFQQNLPQQGQAETGIALSCVGTNIVAVFFDGFSTYRTNKVTLSPYP